MSSDIVVVGAGLSGIIAACAAQKTGATVTLLDRGTIGLGSNSAMSNAGFSAPNSNYKAEDYISDTIAVGCGFNKKSYVKLTAEQIPQAFSLLNSLGIEIHDKKFHLQVLPSRNDVIPGSDMMRCLAAAVVSLDNINFITNFQVREIAIHNGQAQGVIGTGNNGQLQFIAANAVVLAAGGAGAVYQFNDNMKSTLGQSYRLAADAGLDLLDMEFVQFYPLVLAEPNLPAIMLYPPYPPEARILNSDGQDLMARHGISNINTGIMKMRDQLSALLFEENLKAPVKMDYTQVPESSWSTQPLAILSKLKFDFRKNPVSVSPGAHFCMGGVEADENSMTSLPGLFACGEVLWGLHGANRRGGNALTECVVSGRLAGIGATRFANQHGAAHFQAKLTPLIDRQTGGTALKQVLDQLRSIAWNRAGVIRSNAGIATGLGEVREWWKTWRTTNLKGPRQQLQHWELGCGGRFLEAVLVASALRHESVGAFINSDFPTLADHSQPMTSVLSWQKETRKFEASQRPVPSQHN